MQAGVRNTFHGHGLSFLLYFVTKIVRAGRDIYNKSSASSGRIATCPRCGGIPFWTLDHEPKRLRGPPRDQVLASFLTNFEWTTHGSEAFRRAATGNSSGVTPASSTSPAKQNASSGVSKSGVGGLGGAGGQRGGTDADSSVSDRNGLSKSLRKSLFDKFGSPAKVVPEGALRWTAGKSSGPGGGDGVPQRRATHDGVVESGELGLRVHMMHFRPEQFMDPDTAAQVWVLPREPSIRSLSGREGIHGLFYNMLLADLPFSLGQPPMYMGSAFHCCVMIVSLLKLNAARCFCQCPLILLERT